MTYNGLKAKIKGITPNRSSQHPSKIQAQRENTKSSKLRHEKSKKQHDKILRRGMRGKKLNSAKSHSTRLPYIPQKVLRVLKILRHEKFLDMVQKYFAPSTAKSDNNSASRLSTNKDSLIAEA